MRYVFRDCVLDTGRHVLMRGDAPVAVEPQVFDLLHLLARNAGQLVTRDEILAEVWNGRIVSESAISARIAAARKAVGDDGKAQRVIRTIARRGLQMVTEVTERTDDTAPVRLDLGPTVPLETFIVNLSGAAGERYLKVAMELELKESSLVVEVEKRTPQVRDTILLLLSSKTFDDIATFRGKTKLRNEITSRLNAVLPPASIKKVYFTEFVVQ